MGGGRLGDNLIFSSFFQIEKLKNKSVSASSR
jgi:hypothetical protein